MQQHTALDRDVSVMKNIRYHVMLHRIPRREAEGLCDRVAIIDHGRIVRTGSPGELCESIGEWAVEYRSEGRKHYRYFSDREESRRFLDSLPPDSQTVSRSTNLEDVFLELTGRDTVATEEVSYKI